MQRRGQDTASCRNSICTAVSEDKKNEPADHNSSSLLTMKFQISKIVLRIPARSVCGAITQHKREPEPPNPEPRTRTRLDQESLVEQRMLLCFRSTMQHGCTLAALYGHDKQLLKSATGGGLSIAIILLRGRRTHSSSDLRTRQPPLLLNKSHHQSPTTYS